MTESDFIEYVDRERLDVDAALRLLTELEESDPMKPWTLISRVKTKDEDFDTLRTEALKPLTLKGYITPNANGDLRVDSRKDFREDYLR